jgi:uncharacterized membrane protein YhaH (DUF805 family)
VRRHLLTAVAAVLVLGALLGPDDIGQLSTGTFLRLPVEALVGAAVLVLLPARPRRLAALAAGVLLGLIAVLKVVDVGFSAVLARPFDLVLDWRLLGDAAGVVEDSVGRAGALGAVVGALLLLAATLVLLALSVRRLADLGVRNDGAALRMVAVLSVVWVGCALAGTPVAARNTAALVHDRVGHVRAGLHDQQVFAALAGVDRYAGVPGDRLLTGLRGKDVIITFVESYGRSAIEHPDLAPPVNALLDAGTRRLDAAGFGSRSAFLTSSTVGGESWLAHGTLLSGLWIDTERRHRSLTAGDRLTLPRMFGRAGWRTVSVEPAIDRPWPEGRFYGYDRAYDSRNLGYRGPRFSYATMPDQYAFATFQRRERGPGHRPVMAEITLVSSHSPWTPLPRLVGWDAVGDGSVFHDPGTRVGGPASTVLGSPSRLRAAYRQSIEYSLSMLISYVQEYGGDDLVLVLVGDHQPAPVVTGARAGRDVPVTIVARDRAVLDRVAGWGWDPGLNPGPGAPVWRMDAFRDRFVSAFGPPGSGH